MVWGDSRSRFLKWLIFSCQNSSRNILSVISPPITPQPRSTIGVILDDEHTIAQIPRVISLAQGPKVYHTYMAMQPNHKMGVYASRVYLLATFVPIARGAQHFQSIKGFFLKYVFRYSFRHCVSYITGQFRWGQRLLSVGLFLGNDEQTRRFGGGGGPPAWAGALRGLARRTASCRTLPSSSPAAVRKKRHSDRIVLLNDHFVV